MTQVRPRWPRGIGGIAFGADYNPDQWPESVWGDDVRLMRQAHINLVTVGVFSWSRLQPRPDTWDLDWLDRALDLLHANGIGVDLATATASPPPWFSSLHPDSLPVDARGARLGIGSRQHVCPSSPDFADAATALVERLAERYAQHPALVMWHIGNEYGDHIEACYCDVSAAHFRTWLQARYGSLQVLNDAWTTSVWSGRFGDWAEIMPPRAAPGPILPALQLDFRRFSSDALLTCFERERAVLARITPDIPVTTNFMRPSPGIDQWRFAARGDVVSLDLYPDPLDPFAETEVAFTHDLMRSLGEGRPWLLMEQAMSSVDWRQVNVPQAAAVVRRRNLGAIGRGADGLLFFQWRGSRGGPEMLHSTMLPAGGTDTRGWRQTVALGTDVACLAEVAGSRCPRAAVGLVIDWDAWWALEQEGHPTDRLGYRDLALRMYEPLREANVPVDMCRPDADLSALRLVLIPNLFLLSTEAAANLASFVRVGGVALVGPFSGIVDASYRLPGGHHPGMLRDLLGITIEEWWPITEGESTVVSASGERTSASIWRDAIDLRGAEAVRRFEGGDLDGWPAVTRNSFGAGQAWYLGTLPDRAGARSVMLDVLTAAGVTGDGEVPEGVEMRWRDGPGASFLFLANRTEDEVTVPLDVSDGFDLLTGTPVADHVQLGAHGVAVVRVPTRAQ